MPEEKVKVIHNGLDFSDYKMTTYPQDPPVLGMLSRLIPGKGVDMLTEAFIHIKKEKLIPRLKLKIAGSKTKGENAFLNSVSEKLESAGVLDDVEFSYNLSPQEKIDFLSGLTVFSVPASISARALVPPASRFSASSSASPHRL